MPFRQTFLLIAVIAFTFVAAPTNGAHAQAQEAQSHSTVARISLELGGYVLGAGLSIGLTHAMLNAADQGRGWGDVMPILGAVFGGAGLVLTVPPAFASIAGGLEGGNGSFWVAGLGNLVGLGVGMQLSKALIGEILPGTLAGYALLMLPGAVGTILGYELTHEDEPSSSAIRAGLSPLLDGSGAIGMVSGQF